MALESSVYLTRLRLSDLKFGEEGVFNQRLLDIIKSKPIQKLELYIRSSEGMIIAMNTLDGIFNALNNRNLEYLHLELGPQISETPSEDQVANLQHSFTEFLKNQAARLCYFDVEINFCRSDKALGLAPFSYIPEFIKANKEKVEKYEIFYVWIKRMLF